MSSSSDPKRRLSPAWGFSAHSAILGEAIPNQSESPRRVISAASTIARAVTAAGTSLSGMCLVASTTRSFSDASIIATREPVRAASISV